MIIFICYILPYWVIFHIFPFPFPFSSGIADYLDVLTEVIDIEENADKLATTLGLLPGSYKPNIHDIIKIWLQQNYDTKRHGLPSYRKLAEAVAHKVGPSNPALAKKIATKHSG